MPACACILRLRNCVNEVLDCKKQVVHVQTIARSLACKMKLPPGSTYTAGRMPARVREGVFGQILPFGLSSE